MFVELHILQNFAPANLNRDDRGAPKDCEFGGVRRARVSSQCLKRAIRTEFKNKELLPEESLATRTKRIVEHLAKKLVEAKRDEAEAQTVAAVAVSGIGFGTGDDGKTQYLLYVGQSELKQVVSLCVKHWDALLAAAPSTDATGKKATGKDAKKAGKNALDGKVRDEFLKALDGRRAADLALFGRMLADMPDRNVDAACQVAHAISTNRLSAEFDFYTAVDDLKPEDTAGADMLGTVEFNSACFYRYAALDCGKLAENLGDAKLARQTVEAFIKASVDAVPTGKQNSTAAQSKPSLVLAVVREGDLWSMANAFIRPIRPDADGDLIANSIKALDTYWGKLNRMYDNGGIKAAICATTELDALSALKDSSKESINEIVNGVLAAVDASGTLAKGAAKAVSA